MNNEWSKVVEEGVSGFLRSDQWSEYLKFSARFHQYSFCNTFLIMCQMPAATRVAGYNAWKKMGRQVQRDEHGIKIFVPFKGKVIRDDEEHEVLKGFGIGNVFDVSQTKGDPLPEIVTSISGDDQVSIYAKLLQLAKSKGLEVEFEKMGAFGYLNANDKIGLAEGHDLNQSAQTLAHELAHWYLAHLGSDISRDLAEFEAESTAFVLCEHFGFATHQVTMGYLASWCKTEQKLHEMVISSGTRVMKAAKKIIEALEEKDGKKAQEV